MSVDFCQIELRVLAHLSKDPTLLAALNSSGDVFVNLSSKWYKIPETEVCAVQNKLFIVRSTYVMKIYLFLFCLFRFVMNLGKKPSKFVMVCYMEWVQ